MSGSSWLKMANVPKVHKPMVTPTVTISLPCEVKKEKPTKTSPKKPVKGTGTESKRGHTCHFTPTIKPKLTMKTVLKKTNDSKAKSSKGKVSTKKTDDSKEKVSKKKTDDTKANAKAKSQRANAKRKASKAKAKAKANATRTNGT